MHHKRTICRISRQSSYTICAHLRNAVDDAAHNVIAGLPLQCPADQADQRQDGGGKGDAAPVRSQCVAHRPLDGGLGGAVAEGAWTGAGHMHVRCAALATVQTVLH